MVEDIEGRCPQLEAAPPLRDGESFAQTHIVHEASRSPGHSGLGVSDQEFGTRLGIEGCAVSSYMKGVAERVDVQPCRCLCCPRVVGCIGRGAYVVCPRTARREGIRDRALIERSRAGNRQRIPRRSPQRFRKNPSTSKLSKEFVRPKRRGKFPVVV